MKTSDELFEKYAEQQQQLERDIKTTKQGVVFCFVDKGYTIAWNRIRSEADLVSWIYHLSGKIWLTQERLRRFLELVADKKGWDLHCAP